MPRNHGHGGVSYGIISQRSPSALTVTPDCILRSLKQWRPSVSSRPFPASRARACARAPEHGDARGATACASSSFIWRPSPPAAFSAASAAFSAGSSSSAPLNRRIAPWVLLPVWARDAGEGHQVQAGGEWAQHGRAGLRGCVACVGGLQQQLRPAAASRTKCGALPELVRMSGAVKISGSTS